MTPLFGKDNSFKNSPQADKPKDSKTIGTEYSEAEIYCDGACSGNPGKAGIGVVIITRGKKEKELRISEYIGEATNNIAEYTSLLKGLKETDLMGIKKARVFMDSELVVKQIKGEYKVKNRNLKELWLKVMQLIDRFEKFEISHIRREMNEQADSLAREAVSAGKMY